MLRKPMIKKMIRKIMHPAPPTTPMLNLDLMGGVSKKHACFGELQRELAKTPTKKRWVKGKRSIFEIL